MVEYKTLFFENLINDSFKVIASKIKNDSINLKKTFSGFKDDNISIYPEMLLRIDEKGNRVINYLTGNYTATYSKDMRKSIELFFLFNDDDNSFMFREISNNIIHARGFFKTIDYNLELTFTFTSPIIEIESNVLLLLS